MAHTISCRDCGHPRAARNRNTRYCHRCRLLRNVEFFRHAHSHRKCRACEKSFAPVDRADEFCGDCELGYSTMRGECLLCKEASTYLVRPEVRVCKSCAREPTLRNKLIHSLQLGQLQRIANPPQPQEAS